MPVVTKGKRKISEVADPQTAPASKQPKRAAAQTVRPPNKTEQQMRKELKSIWLDKPALIIMDDDAAWVANNVTGKRAVLLVP